MADQIVWGVRVTDEFKERITKVIEQSGMKAQDYLENLIDQYQINNVKDNPFVQADINELQMLTSRINSIYVNVSERLNTYMQDSENKHQEAIAQKNQDLDNVLVKVNELKVKNQELENEKGVLETSNAEHAIRIKDLEDTAETSKALIAEYKEKNDMLTGLLSEYQGYKDNNAKLHQELEAEKDKNRESELTIKTMANEIDTLKGQIKREHSTHGQELVTLQEKASFEKAKAILELNIQHQQHIQEITEQHNAKVKELIERMEAKKEEKPQPKPQPQERKKRKAEPKEETNG